MSSVRGQPTQMVKSRCDAVALGQSISVAAPRLAVPCWLDHGPPAASGRRLGAARAIAEPARDSHSALPPIRIHTELKGPEAVIIDTSGFGLLPMPPEHDIAVAPSQLLRA